LILVLLVLLVLHMLHDLTAALTESCLLLEQIFELIVGLRLLCGQLLCLLHVFLPLVVVLVVLVRGQDADCVTHSKPSLVFNPLSLAIDGEEDDLVDARLHEQVHDLVAVYVELCLYLVLVHWHFRVVLLIGLEKLSNEESSHNSEESCLAELKDKDKDPDHGSLEFITFQRFVVPVFDLHNLLLSSIGVLVGSNQQSDVFTSDEIELGVADSSMEYLENF